VGACRCDFSDAMDLMNMVFSMGPAHHFQSLLSKHTPDDGKMVVPCCIPGGRCGLSSGITRWPCRSRQSFKASGIGGSAPIRNRKSGLMRS
jgi:hypothetical protein